MPLHLLKGIPASPGIVVGPVHLLRWEVTDVTANSIETEDVDRELERLRIGLARAVQRLKQIRERAARTAGVAEAGIFEVQISIIEDEELRGQVADVIRQRFTAERAFDVVMLERREYFARSPHAMLRERVNDLIDVHIRVLTLLLDLPDHDPVDLPRGSNAILVTHDLTPSLTLQLDRETIAAIATDAGTKTSHVAILARSLGLPAVVGLLDATSKVRSGEQVILDGTAGTIVTRPSSAAIAEAATRQKREAAETVELAGLVSQEAISRDGVRVQLLVNVDLPEEAEAAARSGAEGVGLMRTEFLVVGRPTMPDEEEQFEAYAGVVRAFPGKPVIIRTFDVGGDKLPIGGWPHEPNPFLGWRAIRMCLDQPEIFKTQLRALLRVAMLGDVRINLPLVVTVDEVRQARALIAEASRELTARGVEHRSDVPIGIMVETPAAAVLAESLAKDVSFFSIGTNDLVQYTLAVDRGNAALASRYTPLHPAVLRLIHMTRTVGEKHGVEVGVCGEMASEPIMAFALLGLGIRSLSVSPIGLARVKLIVRGMRASVATEAAEAAMNASTAAESEKILRDRLLAEVPSELLHA
jgi:phosphotransferase system enzyme I (PtsI)